MAHSIERPQNEEFLSKKFESECWKPSNQCFSPDEESLINRGKIIYVKIKKNTIKFVTNNKSGKLRSISFIYDGDDPKQLFKEKFGEFYTDPDNLGWPKNWNVEYY